MIDKTDIPQTTDTPTAKRQLRAHAVAIRRLAQQQGGPVAAERLAVQAESLPVRPGDVVAGYWPMGDEIDPRPLMERLAGHGCPLALPVVAVPGQGLTFRAWEPGDVLEPGPHGTLHPAAAAPPLVPRVVLVPLLAFDRNGFRLGYGGGYYDRTLESLRRRDHVITIGLGFAVQCVAAVPRDGHDQRLDLVATEDGLIRPETT